MCTRIPKRACVSSHPHPLTPPHSPTYCTHNHPTAHTHQHTHLHTHTHTQNTPRVSLRNLHKGKKANGPPTRTLPHYNVHPLEEFSKWNAAFTHVSLNEGLQIHVHVVPANCFEVDDQAQWLQVNVHHYEGVKISHYWQPQVGVQWPQNCSLMF